MFHYCVVRRDLSTGKAGAMLIHAARESGAVFPFPEDTYAGAVTVLDEPALRALAQVLDNADVDYRGIIEDAAPYAGQLMALGIAPAPKSTLRRYLAALPSFGKPQETT